MTDGPIQLRGAQKAIRDEYFGHGSGLFTLDCVPGSGKSVVAYHLAAEDILTRYVEGDRTPEQHVAVISFTRGEASSIVPEVCARLRELVEHDLVPAADHVSERELEHLLQRVRRAPYAGTIDSVLRDVLAEIVDEVGFSEMPAVGNDARMKRLHDACYQELQRDSDLVRHLARLEYAYPSEQYRDGVSEILESAVSYCRDRRLSTREFYQELVQTVESVYPGGRPASFDDVVDALRRFTESDLPEAQYDDLTDEERRRIADADARLHDAWTDRLDDFCMVLDAYRETYRDAIRERGSVSHTDVAYLIDAYFQGQLETADVEHRERVKDRYQTRIRSLVIDEAQDVSSAQHAALSHLVAPDTRVFGSGDLLQSIYLWRNADPALFESATQDGEYLGIDWDTHEHRTATTTYRCRPDVAAAINEVSEPILTDAVRGDLGELDVDFSGLDAYREPTDEANIHVAAFNPLSSDPDSFTWCSPAEGRGEAETVATLVSKGLDDGTFTDNDGEPLDVTVLFRWGSKMGVYEEAFADEELRVRNASENLFDCAAVETVVAVCEWLVSPASTTRTRCLVTETDLGLQPLADAIETRDGELGRVRDECELSEAQEHVLNGLTKLRDHRDAFGSRPASTYIEDVIEALALRADPYGFFPELDAAQRTANLDALTEILGEWEDDDQLPPRELTELVQPFRESPHLGPNQPSTTDSDADVEFRTVHSAKGDESDVVVLANPGFSLWRNGVQSERFVKQGTLAGLAPPMNADTPSDISLPPYQNGVYDPDDTRDPDIGLRWMTAYWTDDVVESADHETLVGPERLRRFAANQRAEGWRLLYVALTRAREHLVVPLPRSCPYESQPRDRWLDAIRERLDFTEERTGTYTLDPSSSAADPFEVGVNDVELNARWTPEANTSQADVAVTPPRVTEVAPWVPRFIRPSTIYPLTEDPSEYVLPHLLGKALHTTTNDVPDDHPLLFARFGPDDVGTCLHDILTTLIERNVSESTLRSRGDIVHEVFDETIYDMVSNVSDSERDALFTFFDEQVLDDFVDSDLWHLLHDAETVAVEKPVDGLATVGDVEVEIHGTADVLVETSDGERHVSDIKISLTELTDETRRRYELQVATYAYLFEHQQTTARPVRRSVETFGVERETITSSWPPSVIEQRLSRLLRG